MVPAAARALFRLYVVITFTGSAQHPIGGPNPFSTPWLGFPRRPSGVDIILDLGVDSPPLTWLAAHVLLVSPVWFVDGSAGSRVYRNITSSLPASVVFRVADVLSSSSAITAPWRECEGAVARPWSGECW